MPELKRLEAGHAPAVLDFELANRAWFAASVSDRGDDYFDRFSDHYDALLAEQEAGVCAFYVLLAEEDGSVLGRFNLVDLAEGTAHLGYRVAQHAAGRGVATEAVRRLCALAATRHGLHTLRAAASHGNAASARVLAKAGFVPIGPADPAHLGGKQGTWYRRDLTLPGSPSIPANRRLWNRISGAYQHEHDPQIGAAPRLWGMYSLPDAQLHALGDVTGKRVLELGCGAGQWSRALAAEGARVVGLDLSEAQLAAAARAMGTARYPLVQGAAEQLPFAAASFDVVFCDFGGLSWAPPHLAVPQAARVLVRGGRLVFNVASPWFEACYDEGAARVTRTLRQDYFGLGTVAEDDGASSYQLTYGGWVKVLRGAGLVIDDLIEPRPGPAAPNGYNETDPPDWAHRWPAELLWVTHKP